MNGPTLFGRNARSARPWRRLGVATLVAMALTLAGGVRAAVSPSVETEHLTAFLVSEHDEVVPGQPFVAALVLVPERGWHTYWQNPGDTGLPTRVDWTLPEGASAGEFLWPAPERIEFGELINYGYHGQVVLPVVVSPGSGLAPGARFDLAGRARWLVCEEVCIPGRADLSLTLPVAAADAAAPVAASGRWRARLERALVEAPQPLDAGPARFAADGDGELALEVVDPPDDLLARASGIEFFPLTRDVFDYGTAPVVTRDGRRLHVRAGVETAPLEGAISGVLVVDGPDGVRQYRVEAEPASAPIPAPANAAADASAPALAVVLLLGFAGGVVLNLMPCVFPVLSLKVLKLVEGGAHGAMARRLSGLAYAAGTIASFLVVAAVLIGLRGAGQEIGWGFQLQSPPFVAAMAYLMFFLGLSLSGVVEVGAGLTRVGNVRTDETKLAGSFLTGVLATIVATPCTAPFMGTAMGYAMTQPVPVALAVFAALGLGLASPFLVISFVPALAGRLPRPGRWMATLKEFLAFPLYLTAVWLVWVLARQAGTDALAGVLVGAVLIGFAAWVWRRGVQGGVDRVLPKALAGLGVAGAVALLPGLPGFGAGSSEDASAYPATAYSGARLEEALASGRTVFVNFTADWCITCKVNERVAIGRASVVQAFEARDVVYLKGDWTEADPEITRVLESFGRSGVPLYLVYRKGATEPRVLPQILTPELVRAAVGAG